MQMSRKSADMLIQAGQVTLAGDIVLDPGYKITMKDAFHRIKVAGRLLRLPDVRVASSVGPKDNLDTTSSTSTSNKHRNSKDAHAEDGKGLNHPSTNKHQPQSQPQPMRTRVWLAHKLAGELVAEHDPEGRPSLIERLERGGVGKPKSKKKHKHQPYQPVHLKAIGRLDMITEGLILITNDGAYKREMELPSHTLHRTYRVRVHGRITPGKLKALRSGMQINGTYYKGMKVNIETTKKGRNGNGNGQVRVKGGNTNTWLRITCVEGKNRQIRRTLDHLGLRVTRLIRIAFGDYDLNTIPPGMAIEVPVKSLESQKKRGALTDVSGRSGGNAQKKDDRLNDGRDSDSAAPSVEWIRYQ